MENTGEIELVYSLVERGSGPVRVQFLPSSGRISTGEQLKIRIVVNYDVLGQFSENFLFELEVI